MGNFNNTTLGVGSLVQVDGIDLGYTRGDIQFTRDAETLPFETGIPLQTVGQVPLRDRWSAIVPMGEITARNIAYASLNIPLTTIAGTAATVAAGVVGPPDTRQKRTFVSIGGGAVQNIQLDGGTVTGLVVKSLAGTSYVVNTDYILDAVNGVVYRNPTGTIPANSQVHVAYGYTPLAEERLNLGVNAPVTTRSFYFEHTSPVSGRVIAVRFWKAQAKASFEMNFQEQDYMVINLELEAIPDEEHPESPLGYMSFIA